MWYIIGFGPDEAKIRSKIEEFHMQQRVILLGKKENPYPYIKECDVYIQPSRYEGKSVTVREAQMFGKPVIITEYSTAKSQLENGIDGMIVPISNQKCAEAICWVLENKDGLHELEKNCKKRDYSNAKEILKIYDLIKDEN